MQRLVIWLVKEDQGPMTGVMPMARQVVRPSVPLHFTTNLPVVA
jgi:hypothetical protein